MRLLNTETRHLNEFYGDEIPKYAILSHTWESEEILFTDIGTLAATEKTGYQKFDSTCKKAISNGYRYVWIDTCCIDKSSSAELSESINSMFEWYFKADKCYVYLADVSKAYFKETFSSAKWFTRGWTLQELIAPYNVFFYDRDWKFLGTKHDLITEIRARTSIDSTTLRYPLAFRKRSIAKRMSWASRRTTTRKEDMAYCMLGLFDIHMPMLYGEGNAAFRRLQEEIIRTSDDQTILVWGYALNASEQLFDKLGQPTDPCMDLSFRESDILTSSPYDFRNSGDFVSVEHPDALNIPTYAMTNRGLHISLPIARLPWKEIGLLACSITGYNQYCVGILLGKTTTGRRSCYHMTSPSCRIIKVPMSAVLEAEVKTVYIMTERTTKLTEPAWWGNLDERKSIDTLRHPHIHIRLSHQVLDWGFKVSSFWNEGSLVPDESGQKFTLQGSWQKEHLGSRPSWMPMWCSVQRVVLIVHTDSANYLHRYFALFIQLPDPDEYQTAAVVKIFKPPNPESSDPILDLQSIHNALPDPGYATSFYNEAHSTTVRSVGLNVYPLKASVEEVTIWNHKAYKVDISEDIVR